MYLDCYVLSIIFAASSIVNAFSNSQSTLPKLVVDRGRKKEKEL